MANLTDKLFEYTPLEIDRKAIECRKANPYLSSFPPIRADKILDRLPDVEPMKTAPLLLLDYGVEAMVMKTYMTNKLTVLVDEGIMNQRDPAPFNMAIAEEIGHLTLHRAAILEVQEMADFEELQFHPRWAKAEQDAKRFARALLMPPSMLEARAAETFERIVQEIGFSEAHRIRGMFLVQLAKMFEIPNGDAQKRIGDLGLDIRLDNSIAARSLRLLELRDEIAVRHRSVGLAFP